MIRKTILTLATTAGLLAGSAGVASAHECFVANRSDQGNAGASHSANWYTLQMSDLFSEAHLFFGGEPLTADQLAWALEETEKQGLPLSVTMFERFTIPRSQAEFEKLAHKSGDGKGIDHFFSSYGDDLFLIFSAAQAR